MNYLIGLWAKPSIELSLIDHIALYGECLVLFYACLGIAIWWLRRT